MAGVTTHTHATSKARMYQTPCPHQHPTPRPSTTAVRAPLGCQSNGSWGTASTAPAVSRRWRQSRRCPCGRSGGGGAPPDPSSSLSLPSPPPSPPPSNAPSSTGSPPHTRLLGLPPCSSVSRLRALRASGETLELGSTAALPLSGGGAGGVPAITFSSNLHLHSGQARFSCGGSTRSYALALLVPAFCLFPVWNVSMCFGRQDPHKP